MAKHGASTPNGIATLDAEARRLHADWERWKTRLADHKASLTRNRERVTALRQHFIAAQVEDDAKRTASVRAELNELETRLASADAVEKGLHEKARAAGLTWSTAWTAWHSAVESDLLGDFPRRRAALNEAEAKARAELERLTGEMPA